MARATPQSLTRKERALLAETQPERLRAMDEEALIDLHARERRARDRFEPRSGRSRHGRVVTG